MRSCYSVEVELAIVGLVLLAWQAARIPLEGNVDVSVAHAHSVLHLESLLSIDVEAWTIEHASRSGIVGDLAWMYTNIHLPVLFGAVAALRVLAPDRYPRLRTTFVLSFIPAIFVIGLYPLAPPRWLPGLGLGPIPDQSSLAGTSGEALHNSTAAAASQHFGFAIFVAASLIWIFPRSRLAWLALAYPALVFLVIVGTGNHYVLDCIVGALTFALAAGAAWLLHRDARRGAYAVRPSEALATGVGYAVVTWGFVSLDMLSPLRWSNVLFALVLVCGIAIVASPRMAAREALAESG
jgi:PAP2 superfamily